MANYRRRLVDMTEEERAEVAPGSAAYGNFLGNTGDKNPLSVQMAETGLDLATPIGTIQGIQDELDKKDPSYALIAGMAGLELLGPAAGAIRMAAKSGNKSVIQKILGSFKSKPAPGFEEGALKTAANQNDLSREILVEMPIDDFLAAAKKEVSPEKLENTRRLISEGTPFETVPSLQFKNNGDGTAKVIGHDGRHRAMALKEQGETTIPVRLQSFGGDGPSIRWGQQNNPSSSDYVDTLPKQLVEEDGEALINMPDTGIRRKEDDAVLRSKFAEFDPSKKDKPELGLAQGGAVDNMSMKKQMSLFEYGGIADDGMNKDPVSGNNVPPGSLAKEVRDDIPAMLSEGEYVVPADVLRYYGVNFFENLRGQAKQGLNTMEQNGRIGGTPMTQQDVARNMQQPMAPAPVQAAQGAMMQSPMRVQQQPAPQAVGNSGIPTQGYAGENGSIVSRWSPARARYSSPMFQGTSSQQQNIQAAQEQAAQEQAATEEITYMRTHYNQNGESVQVAYEGTDPESATPKAGQDQLLSDYPLTEEEWAAYTKEMSQNTGDDGGSGGGGDTTVSGGSDTSWMDGIDFTDTASVKKWVESDDGLGMSGGARQLANKGVLGLIPQGIQANDIAKTRGIRSYYESIGDTEMVDYLDGQLKDAMKETGLLTSALDKLGLLTGDSYFKQLRDLDPVIPDNVPGFQARVARQKTKVAEGAEAQKAEDDAAAAAALKAFQSSQDDDDDDDPPLFGVTNVEIDRDPLGQGSMTTTYDGIDPGLTTASFEEDPEYDYGVNEGGLMTAPKLKKKKKSKPRNTGLAGKR